MNRYEAGLGVLGALTVLGGSCSVTSGTGALSVGAALVITAAGLAVHSARTRTGRRRTAAIASVLILALGVTSAARLPLKFRWWWVSGGFDNALHNRPPGGDCRVEGGWALGDWADTLTSGFGAQSTYSCRDAMVFLARLEPGAKVHGVIYLDRGVTDELRESLPGLELVPLGDGFAAFTADTWWGWLKQ